MYNFGADGVMYAHTISTLSVGEYQNIRISEYQNIKIRILYETLIVNL